MINNVTLAQENEYYQDIYGDYGDYPTEEPEHISNQGSRRPNYDIPDEDDLPF